MKRLLFISPGNNLVHLGPALPSIAAQHHVEVHAENILSYQLSDGVVSLERLSRSAREADIILVDLRAPGPVAEVLWSVRRDCPETLFIPLMGGSMEVMGLCRMGSFNMDRVMSRSAAPGGANFRKIQQITGFIEKLGSFLPVGTLRHARNWVRAIRYWTAGGQDNIENFLHMLLREYCDGNGPRPQPPMERPNHFLGLPGEHRICGSIKAFLDAHPLDARLPNVAVLFYSGMHSDASIVGVRALLSAFDGRANVLPIGTNGVESLESIRRFLFHDSSPKIDALISLLWFRLNGGPLGGDPDETKKILDDLDVPYIVPATLYGRELEKWQGSPEGLSPVETYATVVLPELDGALGPAPLFGLTREDAGGFQVTHATALEDRARIVAERTLAWIRLRKKDKSQRKIAIICYDYPPGAGNAGNASYLDVSASVSKIFECLAQNGYDLGPGSENPINELIEAGIHNGNDRGDWRGERLSASEYKRAFASYPERPKAMVEEVFGPAPGRLMIDEAGLRIPCKWYGNVMLGMQPARMPFDEDGKATHDKGLPPHHQYLAFYEYLKARHVDAVVHVGTHGTVEFTPGKEIALSRECFPDLLQGAIPQLYIYTIANPSESSIAKRRWQSTLLSHHIPDFIPSDLYGEYQELLDLIERKRALSPSDTRAADIEGEVLERAESLDLRCQGLDALEQELTDIKHAAIPQGLHVYGKGKDGRSLVRYITQLFRRQIAGIGLLDTVKERVSALEAEEAIEGWAREFVSLGSLPKSLGDSLNDDAAKTLESALVQLSGDYLRENELTSLIVGLDGRRVAPGLMGDALRSLDVYPTGRNGFSFDPTRIPFPDALERGSSLGKALVERHISDFGRPPQTVGLILWGFETARSGGETIGELLYLIGARRKNKPGFLPTFEPIPEEELDRPRVDVYLMICGFFRDMFPTLVRDLDILMRQIREDVEPDPCGPRIFGPRPGQYGTGLPDYIDSGGWESAEDLGSLYEAAMGYAYGAEAHGLEAREELSSLLTRTDTVSQVIDGDEYKLGDLDHYYEFLGGATRAVQSRRGERPQCLVGDSARNRPRISDAEDELRRYSITRLLNPKWIDGMLAHDYHGAKKIEERITNLIGLGGTIGVPESMFEQVFDRFVDDEEMFCRLRDNNPHATADMVRRIKEAGARKMWNPSQEQNQKLRQRYLSLEAELES